MDVLTNSIQFISGIGRLLAAAALIGVTSTPGGALAGMPPDACIAPASSYHGVNPSVLRAILMVESKLNPKAFNRNENGTVDIGIAQINSMHLGELSKYGIDATRLQDPCIGTYVAAWHLAKQTKKFGNTWYGIASYHSATPYFNKRYQALVHNELVRAGVIKEAMMPVPPLKPGGGTRVSGTTRSSRSNSSSSEGDLFSLVSR